MFDGDSWIDEQSEGHYSEWEEQIRQNLDSEEMFIRAKHGGIMGVPITFLDKYCPEQFDIVGLDRYVPDNPTPGRRFTLEGKETYARILVHLTDDWVKTELMREIRRRNKASITK